MVVPIRPKMLSVTRWELPAYERAGSHAYVLRGTGPLVVSLSETLTSWSSMNGVSVPVPGPISVGTGIAKTHLIGAVDPEGRAQFLDIVMANGRSYKTRHVDDRLEALRKVLILIKDYFGVNMVEPEVVQQGYLPAFDQVEQSGGAGIFLLRPGKRFAVFCQNTKKETWKDEGQK
jgi:hypothetical protein